MMGFRSHFWLAEKKSVPIKTQPAVSLSTQSGKQKWSKVLKMAVEREKQGLALTSRHLTKRVSHNRLTAFSPSRIKLQKRALC